MKKLKSVSLIIGMIITFVIAFSCKKKADEVKEQIIGSMKATISSTSWQAQEPIGKVQNGFLVITGLRLVGNAKQSIILTTNAITVGTYNINLLNGTTNTAIYSPNSDSTTTNGLKYTYTAYSGSINVTTISNNRASGTFEFKCSNLASDTIQVSAGEFKNIYYL
ncbi:MAG: hypothetical protein AUJ97_07585 [Bacteroidetes bacterium CG2_30_32_10]|nr:MAG: hypothetical protein AUJ97_07585 [Bacteroidetes bacterium CG2_30_32_10]